MNQGKRMRSVEAHRALANVRGLTGPERLLCKTLCDYADTNFECYPSEKTLAQNMGCSERTVRRLLRRVREKRVVDFTTNPGRRGHRYRLLFASNADNPDTCVRNNNADNADNLNDVQRPISDGTWTNWVNNPDIALSAEWFEGLGIEKPESVKAALAFRKDDTALSELEDPKRFGRLMAKILTDGVRVSHNEICPEHGPFVRAGRLWEDWVLWDGSRNPCHSYFSVDAGCQGCRKWWARRAEKLALGYPAHGFDLRTPVICPIHGSYILETQVTEHSVEAIRQCEVGRFEQWSEYCPGCDKEIGIEDTLRQHYDFSDEEWNRGKERIFEALAFAWGESRENPSPTALATSKCHGQRA